MTERGVLAIDPNWLKPVTLRIAGECPGEARSHVRIRSHEVIIDEPPERWGSDQGPAPTELQIAALIGVTNVILRRLARRDGVAIHALTVTAEAELDRRGVWLSEPVASPWLSIRLILALATDANDARLAVWREDLARFSPIHVTLRAAGVPIDETWLRSEPEPSAAGSVR